MKMERMKKLAALAICAVLVFAVLTACSGGGTGGSGGGDAGAAAAPAAGGHDFVFEAEHTDLTKIQGAGKSNALEGTAVITYDKFDAGASGDYFVGYLYIKNNVVTFKIHADKDVSGVKFTLRATAESGIESIDANDLKISVNGSDISYRTLSFNGVKAGFFSMDSDGLRAFSDYTISTGIDLHEGDNEITFQVVSDSVVDGTATAKAPILDCIVLTTPDDSDAELTMEPNAASLQRIEQLEDE